MRSNKNDDFGFLDEDYLDESPAPKKATKTKPVEEEYLGFDDDDYKPSSKLPTINSNRNSAIGSKQLTSGSGSGAAKTTKLQSISSTKQVGKNDTKNNNNKSYNEYEDDNDYYEEQIAAEPSSNNNIYKANNNNNNNVQTKNAATNNIKSSNYFDEEEVVESPKKNSSVFVTTPKKMTVSEKPKEKDEGEYDEDFEADDYGEDFEDFHEEAKPKEEKASPPKTLNKQNTVKVINRKPELIKSNSRRSLNSKLSASRSQNGDTRKRQLSKAKSQAVSMLAGDDHKFQNEVAKQFPESVNLQAQSVDGLNKLNQKVRVMIKKLNDQLNDILTKNTLLLKANQNKNKQTQTMDDRLKLLQEDKRNNEKILQRMETEIKKMRFREGKIKEEEYEIDMHKLVQMAMEEKKTLEKELYRLKLEINNEGKRLENSHSRKDGDTLHAVKVELIHQKKEEERYQKLSEDIDQRISDKQDKERETDSRLRKIISEAESLGIDIDSGSKINVQYTELRKKEEAAKKAVQLADSNNKVKKDRNAQENLLMRRKIQNIDAEIKNMHSEIQHVIEECTSIIEKSKENPKIVKSIEASLEMISKSLVHPEPMGSDSRVLDFDRYSERTEKSMLVQNKVRASSSSKSNNNVALSLKGPSKNSSSALTQNNSISMPQNSAHKNDNKDDDFLPLNPKQLSKNQNNAVQSPVVNGGGLKPNFKKKDPSKDDLNIQNKEPAQQRIWKEEETKKSEVAKQPEAPQPVAKEEPKPVVNDISKPSFMFKKRGNNSVSNPEPPKQEPPAHTEQKINHPSPPQEETNPVVEQKKEPEISMKPFSRIMMKGRKQNEDSYNPTLLEPAKEVVRQVAKEMPKPVVEPALTIKQPQNQNAPVEDEIKPAGPRRFMMKKKQDENTDSAYNPTFKKEVDSAPAPAVADIKPQQPSFNINLNALSNDHNQFKIPTQEAKPNLMTNNNSSNPYAPQQQKPFVPRNRMNAPNPPPAQSVVEPPKAQPEPAPVNVNNPYAQQAQGGGGVQREREGKLKKAKVIDNAPKQKLNIFDAAEEVVANQFIGMPSKAQNTLNNAINSNVPSKQSHTHHEQELDINALLGIKKDQTNEDLPFQVSKPVQRKRFGGGIQAKKPQQDDFFGGLNI